MIRHARGHSHSLCLVTTRGCSELGHRSVKIFSPEPHCCWGLGPTQQAGDRFRQKPPIAVGAPAGPRPYTPHQAGHLLSSAAGLVLLEKAGIVHNDVKPDNLIWTKAGRENMGEPLWMLTTLDCG